MGYNTNRLDLTLADVVGDTPEPTFDLALEDDWYLAIDEDWFYDEPYDPEFDYDLHEFEDEDYDEELPEAHDVDDPNEIILPFTGKIGRNSAFPGVLPPCPYGCCIDKRLRKRRRPRYNVKPKRKDHRHG